MRPQRPTPPIPASESVSVQEFPLGGIVLSSEFELQPGGTTLVGNNVRSYEPQTMRARGGSRPGLVEYIPVQVSGPNLIQHLNYVVDPQAQALMTSDDPLGTIPDPSTNNNAAGLGPREPGGAPRLVPVGGSGVAPNRNVSTFKLTPTVTPNNIHKLVGATYTFSGTEFTATGLIPGDQITSVTLTSAGSIASAMAGPYPIGAAFAVGNFSFNNNIATNKYRPIIYNTGVMTVASVVPVAYELSGSGGGSGVGLSLKPFSVNTIGTNYPQGLGFMAWRLVQWLNAVGFVGFLPLESGMMSPTGFPIGITSPAMPYQADFTQPGTGAPWDYQIRIEYSPDGSTWPTPPVL